MRLRWWEAWQGLGPWKPDPRLPVQPSHDLQLEVEAEPGARLEPPMGEEVWYHPLESLSLPLSGWEMGVEAELAARLEPPVGEEMWHQPLESLSRLLSGWEMWKKQQQQEMALKRDEGVMGGEDDGHLTVLHPGVDCASHHHPHQHHRQHLHPHYTSWHSQMLVEGAGVAVA